MGMTDEKPKTCEDYHAQMPDRYLQRAQWAERMQKTHKQVPCPVCGLWLVWVPKND